MYVTLALVDVMFIAGRTDSLKSGRSGRMTPAGAVVVTRWPSTTSVVTTANPAEMGDFVSETDGFISIFKLFFPIPRLAFDCLRI
jgi:hypothetical protein